jgi:hypothetical protein
MKPPASGVHDATCRWLCPSFPYGPVGCRYGHANCMLHSHCRKAHICWCDPLEDNS